MASATSSQLHQDPKGEEERRRPLGHVGRRDSVWEVAQEVAQTLVWNQQGACASAGQVGDRVHHRDSSHHPCSPLAALGSSCHLHVLYLAMQGLAVLLPEERANATLRPLLNLHARAVVRVQLLWSHHGEIVLLGPPYLLQPPLSCRGRAVLVVVLRLLHLWSYLGNVAVAYDPWDPWSQPSNHVRHHSQRSNQDVRQRGRLSCDGVAPQRVGHCLQEVTCHGCNALWDLLEVAPPGVDGATGGLVTCYEERSRHQVNAHPLSPRS